MVGDAVINGGPGLMLIVEKLPWANTLDVTKGVEEAIATMRPGLPGLDIDTTIFRPATFIESSLRNLSNALLLGCLLMILMLFLFLYEWRVALISIVAIPMSLIAGAMVLAWRGTTINTMILAGFAIALGAVVDDAIIDIENVVRRLREQRRAGLHRSTAGVILEASLEVRGAIVYATIIEVVAVVPIFFLEGLSGAFFRPLVFSYAIALMVSMGVALTSCTVPEAGVPTFEIGPFTYRRDTYPWYGDYTGLAAGPDWIFITYPYGDAATMRVHTDLLRLPAP